MEFTLKLNNPKTLADIERLRGNMNPEDFIYRCFLEGIRQADLQDQGNKPSGTPARTAKLGSIVLGRAAPQFHNLDKDAVMEALQDSQHPIRAEVERLVADYKTVFERYRKDTGNSLKEIELVSVGAIQQVAVEIALQAIEGNPATTIRTATKH